MPRGLSAQSLTGLLSPCVSPGKLPGIQWGRRRTELHHDFRKSRSVSQEESAKSAVQGFAQGAVCKLCEPTGVHLHSAPVAAISSLR